MRKPYSLPRPATERTCWRYKLDGMSAYRSTGKRTKRDAEIWVQELPYGKRTEATEDVTLSLLRFFDKDYGVVSHVTYNKIDGSVVEVLFDEYETRPESEDAMLHIVDF